MDPNQERRYSARDLFEQLPTSWKASLRELLRVNPNALQNKPALLGEIVNQIRLHSLQARLNLGADVKDNGKACESRIKGNQMYHPRVMKYDEALKYYNEAIAFAQKGSADRAFVYANRSIICLEQEMYAECLVNIRLARESNYPKRFDGILAVREAKAKAACLAKIATKYRTKHNKASGNRNNRNHHQ
uniref:Uncharacterized protein n=1 Tax=Anopheles maculatus TaxID=74869 RepID=A0A182SCC3_9DIPT